MEQVQKSSRRRWIGLLVIVAVWVIGGVLQAVLWDHFADNRTTQVMSVYIIVPTAVFCTLVWFTFFSGLRVVTKLATFGFLGLCGLAFVGAFRFQGFDGDFVPRFTPRWKMTAEEKFLAARRAEAEYEGDPPILENADKPLAIQPGDWPQFRGPEGNGAVTGVPLKTDWEDGPPASVWRKRVGPAWSSFAVVDGLVFTQMQIGENESVVCCDLETGKEVWVHKDEGVRFEEARAGVGPMGTPTFYQGRLYTLGATGILNCLDPKTGQKFWSTNILKDAHAENLTWGMAGSPFAYEGKIIVNPGSDGEHDSSVAAYDWETGKKLWSGGRNPASYSTPVVATVDGVEQVLMFDGLGLTGHSLQDGSPLWHKEWKNMHNINVAKPILRDDGAIFISTSYGEGSALLRVARDEAGKWKKPEETDWKTNRTFKLKFGDAVVQDGLMYGLSEGILTCLDLKTGKIVWRERGDFGFGQLILVDGVLVILSEEGEVVLIEASKKHPELLRFQAIQGKTWGHPAYAHGRLLVRNAEEMACYDLRPAKSASAEDAALPAQEERAN